MAVPATNYEAMLEDDLARDAEKLGQRERIYLEKARLAFQELNPLPPAWEEPEYTPEKWTDPIYTAPTFMNTMGVQATAMTLSVIGSIAISAFTVGLALYISAVNTDARMIDQTGSAFLESLKDIIPALFFIGGMFAVEGYAFSHEYAVGKENGEVIFSNIPLKAAYAIMIATGLLRSLGLVDATIMTRYPIINVLSQLGVIVSLTIGIPILIGYGARNMGVFRNQFAKILKKSKDDFKRERDDAKEKFDRDEATRLQEFTDKRNLAMDKYQEEIHTWYAEFRKYFENNFSGQVLGIDRGKPQRVRTTKTVAPAPVNGQGFTDSIRIFLKQHNVYPRQVGADGILTPAGLCDQMVDERVPGFGQGEKGRMQISTYLNRLKLEQEAAEKDGRDWLTV